MLGLLGNASFLSKSLDDGLGRAIVNPQRVGRLLQRDLFLLQLGNLEHEKGKGEQWKNRKAAASVQSLLYAVAYHFNQSAARGVLYLVIYCLLPIGFDEGAVGLNRLRIHLFGEL